MFLCRTTAAATNAKAFNYNNCEECAIGKPRYSATNTGNKKATFPTALCGTVSILQVSRPEEPHGGIL